jgi:hypothetical protein
LLLGIPAYIARKNKYELEKCLSLILTQVMGYSREDNFEVSGELQEKILKELESEVQNDHKFYKVFSITLISSSVTSKLFSFLDYEVQ